MERRDRQSFVCPSMVSTSILRVVSFSCMVCLQEFMQAGGHLPNSCLVNSGSAVYGGFRSSFCAKSTNECQDPVVVQKCDRVVGIATCWFKRPQLLRILMPVSKEVPIKHLRFVKHL